MTSPLRLGITCYPTHGGSGVFATELGIALAERGHSVAFVSYSTPLRLGALPDRVTFHEVQGVEYPLLKQFPYTLALAAKMVEVARSHSLQLLHVHYAIPFAPAAILAKQMAAELNLRVVTTLHGTDTSLVGAAPSFRPVTQFAIEQSDAVTTVSEALREETIETFAVQRDIEVIPNCIDPAHYSARKPPEPPEGPATRPLTLLHISNFRPVKRVDRVIDVFAAVSSRVPGIHLRLVGDGPELPRALARARQLGVEDRVETTGVVDDVAPLLLTSDLLLLPSDTESFGLVALEAMASGVPVVASRIGGLPEVVPAGEAGYLIDAEDTAAMVDVASRVLGDSQLRARLGAAGRAHAVEHFSSERIVPRFEALYQRVFSAAGRGELAKALRPPQGEGVGAAGRHRHGG